ncbi:MAG: GHMP kinase [Gammaproteobacteria bacterium]|nr:GHMP kinase [Gammaproteobacteria bacterium]
MTSYRVVASAPASTMLMGEHAVLFGYGALVCALTSRIYVSATSRSDGQVVIESQLGRLAFPLTNLLQKAQQTSVLRFVLQALVHCKLTQGVHLVIESDFEHTLGLGSSAAVTVATLGAMELLMKGDFNRRGVMQLGIESIKKVQGRGSGADVAASALGGIVKFQAHPVNAHNISLPEKAWQNAPSMRLVYCGYKTPTPTVIKQVAQAAAEEPKRFEQLYEQMGTCVDASIKALNNGDWSIFAQSMGQYQGLMENLGVSDETIQKIIQLGQKHTTKGALFGAKISGSGLGDCVLLLGSEKLDWPHMQMPVQIDPQGLRQETHMPSDT